MTPREHALALVKDIVILLRDKGQDFQFKHQFERRELFLRQNQAVSDAFKKLSVDDFNWVASEYEKWFKEQKWENHDESHP